MTQYEILLFFKKNKNNWYNVKEISQEFNITHNNSNRLIRKLYKFGFLSNKYEKILYKSGEYNCILEINYYKYRKVQEQKN